MVMSCEVRMSLVLTSASLAEGKSGFYSLSLSLGLGDDLAGQVRGNLLVAQELHRELTLTPGDRPQVGRVGEHLRHRHLGLDVGHAAATGFHPVGPPATGVQVADDVTNRLF